MIILLIRIMLQGYPLTKAICKLGNATEYHGPPTTIDLLRDFISFFGLFLNLNIFSLRFLLLEDDDVIDHCRRFM
jgi:hypothetical protein